MAENTKTKEILDAPPVTACGVPACAETASEILLENRSETSVGMSVQKECRRGGGVEL